MKREFWSGILLIVLISLGAWFIADLQAVRNLSFSPLIVGIILGMIYANTLRAKQPKSWDEGLKFCSKRMLRLGIILFGFRLTFQNVVSVGTPALVMDVIVVSVTLALGWFVGKRLGMDKETTLMTSAGSAICGAAAVLGVEPIVKGESAKTAVSVSTVVIFGTLSMFLYPILFKMGILDTLDYQQVGIYTGATVHEVAHVVGAGNAMTSMAADDTIASTSLIVKMVRVILLVPVLLSISYLMSSERKGSAKKTSITVPWFAILFLVMIGANSLILEGCAGNESATETYQTIVKTINVVSTFMLTMAMTALGADTSIDKFKQAGAKPFLLAGTLYVWLTLGGFLLVKYLIPMIAEI